MNTILSILPWIQIILAVLLVITILLQAAEESLGGAFGGGTDSGDSPSHTRRGAEKMLFKATIILAIFFVASILLPTII